MTTLKTSQKISQSALAAAHNLPGVMRVLLPGDDAYPDARQIWNGAVDHRPALFAVCETVEDVRAAPFFRSSVAPGTFLNDRFRDLRDGYYS